MIKTRRRKHLILLVAMCLVAAACQRQVLTYDSTNTTPFVTGVIAQPNADFYNFDGSPGAMLVSAPTTNTTEELRDIYWPSDGPAVADQMSCATWTSQSGAVAQQGAALRILMSGTTPVVITVTKNIWLGGFWIFNIHEWFGKYGTIIGQFDLSKTFRQGNTTNAQPLPWNICARAIGRTISFKAWLTAQPKPQWGDPDHGGAVTCDSSFVYEGRAGWYIGHLWPGTNAKFDNLTAWKFVQAQSAIAAQTPASGALTVAEMP